MTLDVSANAGDNIKYKKVIIKKSTLLRKYKAPAPQTIIWIIT